MERMALKASRCVEAKTFSASVCVFNGAVESVKAAASAMSTKARREAVTIWGGFVKGFTFDRIPGSARPADIGARKAGPPVV